MQLRVKQSEGRHLADAFVSQQLVYNVVCRFVPPLVLAFATAEVVFQHGVEALMGYNKLAFLIVQVVHEVRVVANLLAIGHGSTDTVVCFEWHVECHVANERMLKD